MSCTCSLAKTRDTFPFINTLHPLKEIHTVLDIEMDSVTVNEIITAKTILNGSQDKEITETIRRGKGCNSRLGSGKSKVESWNGQDKEEEDQKESSRTSTEFIWKLINLLATTVHLNPVLFFY